MGVTPLPFWESYWCRKGEIQCVVLLVYIRKGIRPMKLRTKPLISREQQANTGLPGRMTVKSYTV